MPKVYQQIAASLQALRNCEASDHVEWIPRHKERIKALASEYLPHGSGFDNRTTLNFDKSTPDKLVFDTAFHHMNEGGYYAGWSYHAVVVTPSLTAWCFHLRVTGRDRNQIKDYIAEVFRAALIEEVKS